MINLKELDKEFDKISKKLVGKKVGIQFISQLRDLYLENNKNNKLIEEIRSKQNDLNKEFKSGKLELPKLKDMIGELKNDLKKIEDKGVEINKTLDKFMMFTPNIPTHNVPIGESETDNVELYSVLSPNEFKFKPKNHWELENGWLDFKRGAKLAGSRFTILRGEGSKLERALINYFLDMNTLSGFEEISVPFLVNENMLIGTGQLPKFKNDLYKVEDENLFLIPTGEVPLTNIYNNEVLVREDLPILLTSNTPCFRKEAGSAGRDTRGMIRQHQFNKVEMVALTTPEQSNGIFKLMVDNVSNILKELELPHRVVQLCTGDLGFSAAETIDIEVWLPGEQSYREISSISNMTDFQSRRSKIRYKNEKKNDLVYTLNGSGVAVGRTLIAIMENHQNEDGSINIPNVLKKYM